MPAQPRRSAVRGQVLIAGGAGFIGSAIARRFAALGHPVVVIDGLCARTGGRRRHLAGTSSRFIEARIEEAPALRTLIDGSQTVVDCMGWTSHVAALSDPLYDEELNLRSHLHLLNATRVGARALFVYLASRGQFGNPPVERISEEAPALPRDVQGIHKLAAELHYRRAAAAKRLDVVSLRLPNTFGPNQPTIGPDIGLVGGFVRTALAGGEIEVYGARRQRNLVYAEDVASIVVALREAGVRGFHALNVAGTPVGLAELARAITRAAGRGKVVSRPMPTRIQTIDVGNAPMSQSRLRAIIGRVPATPLATSLDATVEFFRERLG